MFAEPFSPKNGLFPYDGFSSGGLLNLSGNWGSTRGKAPNITWTQKIFFFRKKIQNDFRSKQK